MFAIVTSFPDRYRRLKEDTDEKRAIIHSRWEAIDGARLSFEHYFETGEYERALGYIGYMDEKCGALCFQFDDAQGYQHMMQKDKSIEKYRIEFEETEQQYFALYNEIRAEQYPFVEDNPRREEYIHRMTKVIARFYKNYDTSHPAHSQNGIHECGTGSDRQAESCCLRPRFYRTRRTAEQLRGSGGPLHQGNQKTLRVDFC